MTNAMVGPDRPARFRIEPRDRLLRASARLVHAPDGRLLGAFETEAAAGLAAKIADSILPLDFERLAPEDQRQAQRRVVGQWIAAGLYVSWDITEDGENYIWRAGTAAIARQT